MMDILRFIARIHESNSIPTSRYHAICMKYAKISQSLIKWVPIAYLVAGSLYATMPIYESFTTGILKPPINLYLPTVNGQNGIEADLLTFLINILAMSLFVITLGTYDSLILLTFFNVRLVSEIIATELYDLQSQLLLNKNIDSKKIKRTFLDIIAMHKQYKR